MLWYSKVINMQAINDKTMLQRSFDIINANIDDEMVLMSIDEGKYYGANKVARKLWELLENPLSFAELCQKVENAFDISEVPNYRDEIIEFLNSMLDQKLITII